MSLIVVFLFLIQYIFVHGWVINNIDVKALARHNLDQPDDLNELAPLSVTINNDVNALRLSLIYPGTKWCGAGNVANNFNDLGSEWQADMCCREHDYCPDTIPASETKYNLTNDVFYTRLSCSCDETFRKCLQAADSLAANSIGIFYFNALSTKCYRKEYPVQKCVKKGGWLNKKCLMYSYNTTSDRIYQWFDVSNYR